MYPSELTHFRKRIGKDGAERILASTIDLHGEKAKEKEVAGDVINLLLAATASNLSLWMRQVLFALVSAIQNWARECRTFHSPLPA